VIGRQSLTGHQIRWQSPGTITADPTNPNHWVVVYNDNFAGPMTPPRPAAWTPSRARHPTTTPVVR